MKTLHRIETDIHLSALSLDDLVLEVQTSGQQFFMIGQSIRNFAAVTDPLGICSFWDVMDTQEFKNIFMRRCLERGLNPYTGRDDIRKQWMQAYVEYVLLTTSANLIVFMPKHVGFLTDEDYTAWEVLEALQHFPELYERIYFVRGLYDTEST